MWLGSTACDLKESFVKTVKIWPVHDFPFISAPGRNVPLWHLYHHGSKIMLAYFFWWTGSNNERGSTYPLQIRQTLRSTGCDRRHTGWKMQCPRWQRCVAAAYFDWSHCCTDSSSAEHMARQAPSFLSYTIWGSTKVKKFSPVRDWRSTPHEWLPIIRDLDLGSGHMAYVRRSPSNYFVFNKHTRNVGQCPTW